jgi:predicted nucleotidyltransferase
MQLAEIIRKVRLENSSPPIPKEIIALYLYGSLTTGKLREESDIDVAFLPSHKTSEKERLILIAQVEGIIEKLFREAGALREVSVLDLRGKYVSLFLQYKVITEGILIYEKNILERLEFENAVKGEYFDFVPYPRSTPPLSSPVGGGGVKLPAHRAGLHACVPKRCTPACTDSRDFRSTELTTKSSLGENAGAGQECPAYRVFEIAAFIPAHPVRTGQAQRGILQHFRKKREKP